MTQRIFDMKNEQDVAELFNLLPCFVSRLGNTRDDDVREAMRIEPPCFQKYSKMANAIFGIDWGNKKYIERPVDKSKWIGCLCWFWDTGNKRLGVLKEINNNLYCKEDTEYWYDNCIPVKREEIKFVEDME